MGASVHNARRAPRIPARLAVDLAFHGEVWHGETEDLSPGGCQLTSPHPLVRGAHLRLIVRCDEVADALEIAGSVAWAAALRTGVAFAPQKGADPDAWVKRFLATQPRLTASRGTAPSELDLDAPLFFLPAPRKQVQLGHAEVALLRLAENGVRVRDLLARAGVADEEARRALFSLFEKNVLTLALGQASDAWRWRALLPNPDAAPLPTIVRTPRPIAAGGLPTIVRGPAAREAPALRLVERAAQAARAPVPPPVLTPTRAAPRPEPRPEPRVVAPRDPEPPPDVRPSASMPRPRGWRPEAAPREVAVMLRGTSPSRRSDQAQARYDGARAAADAGRIQEAVVLLRQALVLAPRDPEISKMLGELAFKDRVV